MTKVLSLFKLPEKEVKPFYHLYSLAYFSTSLKPRLSQNKILTIKLSFPSLDKLKSDPKAIFSVAQFISYANLFSAHPSY